jgi:PAS domain S-box-containing protein
MPTRTSITELTHVDDREASVALADEVRRTGQVLELEKRYLRADGSVMWANVRIAPGSQGGGASQTIVAIDDITESRRARDALAASEGRYRTLVDGLEDVVFVLDQDGTIRFVNRACEHFGYTVEELVGRPFEQFVHPSERENALENARQRLEGALHGPSEYRVLDATGEARHVRVTMRPGVDGMSLTGIVSDLTAIRDTEEQLRVAQKMEAVGQLAGGVAHDFNNLLTVIVSYVDLADESLHESDPLREDLGEIKQAAIRASALTRQLLAFSRKQMLAPEPVDVDGLVGSLHKMLHRVIGEDIEIEHVGSSNATTAIVDRGQLEQVVMNLLVNARDAMPDGGRITIATSPVDLGPVAAEALDVAPGPYIELSVADTGSGMDAATCARIFEPFFTTKEQGKGTGLGLSTVYGIIKQSNGAITVDSVPGEGTTFAILLPACTRGERMTDCAASSTIRGHELIMIVEDEAPLRSAMVRVLTTAGYQLLVAGRPSEAIALAATHGNAIRAIVTDVVMPEMNGRELVAELREHCAAPVLYTSGYLGDALMRSGVASEAFLPKPFEPAALTLRIRQLLDSAPESRRRIDRERPVAVDDHDDRALEVGARDLGSGGSPPRDHLGRRKPETIGATARDHGERRSRGLDQGR